jgi:hypothetical protein
MAVLANFLLLLSRRANWHDLFGICLCKSWIVFCVVHWDSIVGIVTGYGLDDRGVEVESQYGQEFSVLHVIQTGSWVHPTSYPMGTGGSFPGGKRPGREADHLPLASAEVKKMWIYTSTPPYTFMAYCLISSAQGPLYLLPLHPNIFPALNILKCPVKMQLWRNSATWLLYSIIRSASSKLLSGGWFVSSVETCLYTETKTNHQL